MIMQLITTGNVPRALDKLSWFLEMAVTNNRSPGDAANKRATKYNMVAIT